MKAISEKNLERLKARLAATGRLRCRVVTGSMAPLMPVGEIIEVAPLRGAVDSFDILVFRKAGRLMCHYVVHANRLRDEDSVIVTRGLASRQEDLPIRSGDVLGRVVSHRVPWRARLAVLCGRLLRRLLSD